MGFGRDQESRDVVGQIYALGLPGTLSDWPLNTTLHPSPPTVLVSVQGSIVEHRVSNKYLKLLPTAVPSFDATINLTDHKRYGSSDTGLINDDDKSENL